VDLKEILSSIKADDNIAFRYIYTAFGDYCVSSLVKYRSCDKDDAEDLFVDAVMIFRDKVLGGQITNLTNLKSYLYKVCENNFLAKLKSEKRKKEKLSDVEFYYYESEYLTDEEADFSDTLNEATKKAWEKLGERCKDIINYFYVERLRMEQIAELMSFSSADVAKTTKSRCYNN